MNKEVAIFVDNTGQSSLLQKAETVNVYTKENGAWNIIKKVPFSIDKSKDITGIRENLLTIIKALDKCNIIVGKEFISLPYTVFYLADFKIIEAEGYPVDFLDELLQKL